MRKYGTGKVEVDENDEQGIDRESLAKEARNAEMAAEIAQQVREDEQGDAD